MRKVAEMVKVLLESVTELETVPKHLYRMGDSQKNKELQGMYQTCLRDHVVSKITEEHAKRVLSFWEHMKEKNPNVPPPLAGLSPDGDVYELMWKQGTHYLSVEVSADDDLYWYYSDYLTCSVTDGGLSEIAILDEKLDSWLYQVTSVNLLLQEPYAEIVKTMYETTYKVVVRDDVGEVEGLIFITKGVVPGLPESTLINGDINFPGIEEISHYLWVTKVGRAVLRWRDGKVKDFPINVEKLGSIFPPYEFRVNKV